MDQEKQETARNTEADTRGAGVRIPPPLIFLILLLAGYGAEQLWPLAATSWPGSGYPGAGLIATGLMIVLLAARSFKQAETSIEPWKPTHRIITTGIYRWSRNPIYLGFCLVVMGVGLLMNSLWMLISFVPSAVLVYYVAIRREEIYLEKKFGAEYQVYKSRVRRWL